MGESAKKTVEVLETIPTVELPVGVYVSSNPDGTVLIDFGQGPVSCTSAGSFSPLAGDSVRCLRTSAGTIMLGPSKPRAGTGVVKATGTPFATITTSIGDLAMPYLTSYAPVVADLVAIDWAAGGIVLGKVTAVPTGNYTPPVAPPVTDFSQTFRAKDSGSYQGGKYWTTEVWCSDGNIGAWFYGTTIADTIPNGATIRSIQIYLPEFYNEFPSSLATIGLHPLVSKSGAPVVSSATTVSAGTGWKTLPISFGNSLKSGAMKGTGTNHGGYHKFRGRSTDADSGALKIAWRV